VATDPATWNYAPGQVHSTYAKGSVTIAAEALRDLFIRLNDAGVLMQKDVIAFAHETHRRIAMKTPVDTGRARASWHVVPPGTETDHHQYQDLHGQTFDGSLAGESTGPMESIVGTNVEYMIFLEAGHSRQAPEGMVMLSLMEMRGLLAKMIEDTVKKAADGK
jgi:hypothetical protein